MRGKRQSNLWPFRACDSAPTAEPHWRWLVSWGECLVTQGSCWFRLRDTVCSVRWQAARGAACCEDGERQPLDREMLLEQKRGDRWPRPVLSCCPSPALARRVPLRWSPSWPRVCHTGHVAVSLNNSVCVGPSC